jgi:hypothetical protein
LSIPADEPTMNLDSFGTEDRESEFIRVVRHEAGHTLGFPHEHMRAELVKKIDERKAIKYFLASQGWSAQETRQQVLTPLEQSSLWGTPQPDPKSIMCYQIPGTITKDGLPIPGGKDISKLDFAFVAKVYPVVGSAARDSAAKKSPSKRAATKKRPASTKRAAKKRASRPSSRKAARKRSGR